MPNLIRTGIRRWRVLTAVAVGVGILVPTVYTIIRIQTLQTAESQQAKVVTALSSNLAGAQDQLKQHGIQPSQPPPSQIIAQAGPPGPQGSQGPGPSDTQVAAAVSTYLQQHPIAGQPPTTDQVAAVVAVYMLQHPAPPGSPGPSGAAGPGPSDAQIAAAVNAWESGHPVVAPSGPAGPTGPSGPAGDAGPTGPSGAAGSQGPAGPTGPAGPSGPAPSGWVYVDTPPIGNPRTHTCTPTAGTPSPQYSCS